MQGNLNDSFEEFIKWRKSYETCIFLINEQHREILHFINKWYNTIKSSHEVGGVAEFVKDKFDFLLKFSKGHLRFESELLRLLKDDYGFAAREYASHMEKHRNFLETFLAPLVQQVSSSIQGRDDIVLEEIAKSGLIDTARWWYNHIRQPRPGEEPGPDQIYRTYLETLPIETKFEILNHMSLYIAVHSNKFWLIDIEEKL
ncbi:hypothetical protein AAU61_20020 [Desulfocarbo indianensis]|nr:hypothetical protein AAU61_20020 [Desulfocarbo indianensis]